MATIQTDQGQLNALEKVNQKLQVITAINEIAFQTEGVFQISYSRTEDKKTGKRKEQNIVLLVESHEGSKLATNLIQYKHKLKKEIARLVKQYNLALNEAEEASLSDERSGIDGNNSGFDAQEMMEEVFQDCGLAEESRVKDEGADSSVNI